MSARRVERTIQVVSIIKMVDRITLPAKLWPLPYRAMVGDLIVTGHNPGLIIKYMPFIGFLPIK